MRLNRLPYSVDESERFRKDIEALGESIHDWDQIKEAFDLFVAKDPHAFDDVPGTDYKAVTIPVLPPRTIYFLVDEERQCVVLDRAFSGSRPVSD